MHYLLLYDVVDDYLTARAPFRKTHLLHAMAAHQRGEIVLAGALATRQPVRASAFAIEPDDTHAPPLGAVLVFQGDSPKAAEDFAKADPYVINGVVTAWRVLEWTTVVGDNPSLRIDPETL
jgi:uncharacterized protein